MGWWGRNDRRAAPASPPSLVDGPRWISTAAGRHEGTKTRRHEDTKTHWQLRAFRGFVADPAGPDSSQTLHEACPHSYTLIERAQSARSSDRCSRQAVN